MLSFNGLHAPSANYSVMSVSYDEFPAIYRNHVNSRLTFMIAELIGIRDTCQIVVPHVSPTFILLRN